MDKDTYVYCVNCIYGNLLFKRLIEGEEIPQYCENGCDPWDAEDSRRYSERPKYIEKII